MTTLYIGLDIKRHKTTFREYLKNVVLAFICRCLLCFRSFPKKIENGGGENRTRIQRLRPVNSTRLFNSLKFRLD